MPLLEKPRTRKKKQMTINLQLMRMILIWDKVDSIASYKMILTSLINSRTI
jgi:hypothetical protein